MRILKIGVDGGKNSLKVMIQPLFSETYSCIRRVVLSEDDRFEGADFPHTSVKNCFIVACASAAKEKFATVHVLMNAIEWEKFATVYPHVDIRICADFKMINLLCGIGPHSSRWPCPFSKYSIFKKHSKPTELHTADMYKKKIWRNFAK